MITVMNNYEKLKDDLKKLNGLSPYNTPSNICWGDEYFAKSIELRYTREEIKKAVNELGIR